MLIQNAIYIPSIGKYLCSKCRHHFASATLPNGEIVAVDGGLDYCRRVGDPSLFIDFSLSTESTEEEIRNKLLWGVWNGEESDYRPIKTLSLEHLGNILGNVAGISAIHLDVIKYWIVEYVPAK